MKLLTLKARVAAYTYLSKYAVMLGAIIAIPLIVFAANTTQPTPFALTDVPPTALDAYYQAADTCEGLDWAILAGIGKVESNHGRIYANTISPNGDVTPHIFGPPLNGTGVGGNHTPMPANNWAGTYGLTGPWMQAVGPMQFLPPTFVAYQADTNTTPHNMYDATKAAANLLCSTHNGPITNIDLAIKAYNHSDTYLTNVLYWAGLYRQSLTYNTADAQALLINPNIVLAPGAQTDLEEGIVDPRLVTLLNQLSTQYRLYILNFRTGHSRCKVLPNRPNMGPDCSVSNHYLGRATDIIAINQPNQHRQAVTPTNTTAKAVTELLAHMDPAHPLRPDEVGSPWVAYSGFGGHFTNSLHQDHLHVGYHTEPPALPTLEATRAGTPTPSNPDEIADLPGLFDGVIPENAEVEAEQVVSSRS